MQASFNLLDIHMRFCGHGDAHLESIVICNVIYNILLSCLLRGEDISIFLYIFLSQMSIISF